MEFVKDEKKSKLVACKEAKNQLPTDDKMQLQMRELQTYFIQVAPWQEDVHCYALNLEEETVTSGEA